MFLVALAALLLVGCGEKFQPGLNETLYNESANQALESITIKPDGFVEFMFNYSERPEAKYELARDDIFSVSSGDFTSKDISILGIMIGDSYEKVLEELGIPDTTYIAPDKSYKNMEYRRKIGIGGVSSGAIYHLENDTVTIINIRSSFQKYLHGNTSMGTDRGLTYGIIGIPDYQDFADIYRVHHYIEKGLDIYFKTDRSAIYSFYEPKEFKGVTYITHLKNAGGGMMVNVTEAVLNE